MQCCHNSTSVTISLDLVWKQIPASKPYAIPLYIQIVQGRLPYHAADEEFIQGDIAVAFIAANFSGLARQVDVIRVLRRILGHERESSPRLRRLLLLLLRLRIHRHGPAAGEVSALPSPMENDKLSGGETLF
jgi:hypothetical protein